MNLPRLLPVFALTTALLAGTGPAARAAVIVADSFNYGAATTTVDLDTQNGGTNGTGTWAGAYTAATGVDVLDGALSYTGGSISINGGSRTAQVTEINSNSGVNRDFTSQTGTFYFSFLLRLNAGTWEDDDFTQIFLNNGANTSASGLPNLAIGDLSTTTMRLGARATLDSSGGGSSTISSTTNLAASTTYLMVGKVSKVSSANYNTISLFLNPTSTTEGAASATATLNTGMTTLSRFGVRTVNLDAGDNLQFDELKIGTTFADVVTAVPEPGSAMLLLSGLGLVSLMRRRRGD